MADWERFLHDDEDDDIDAGENPEDDLIFIEDQQFVNPTVLEDLARIFSIFLILSVIKMFIFLFSLFRSSWFTGLIDYAGFESLLIGSCALWITLSNRFTVSLAIIGVVLVLQILFIGGLLDRSMINLGRAFATDAIAFSSGVLVALVFRR